MGSKISIDKYGSQLEDILQLNPKNIEKVNLESKIPDSITQNIKIWKFYEEESKPKKIQSSPISLTNLQKENFTFLSTECYVVLVVYRSSKDQENNTFVSFPHQMWGIVESYNNLTPRGLENPLSTSQLNLEILDSFLLPNQKKERNSQKFEHMIFVWNGKNSNPLIKSLALSSAYNLESLIEKSKDNILQIFFSGGVILKDKLKDGKVIQLNSTSNKPHNKEREKEINKMSQTIFLFKFLFPLNSFRGAAAPNETKEGQKNKSEKDVNSMKRSEEGRNNQEQGEQSNGVGQTSDIQEEGMNQQDIEYQTDDVNQQQFYSSSSVDSNTTAASETHYLRFFKKQFCESNPVQNNPFLNNFIHIPASSKKSNRNQAVKKYQDDNMCDGSQGVDVVNQQKQQNQQYNQQQYNQPQYQQLQHAQQEQHLRSNNYLPSNDQYLNIDANRNINLQNNFDQFQQKAQPQNNQTNTNNRNGKKSINMKPLNLSNLNKKTNPSLPEVPSLSMPSYTDFNTQPFQNNNNNTNQNNQYDNQDQDLNANIQDNQYQDFITGQKMYHQVNQNQQEKVKEIMNEEEEEEDDDDVECGYGQLQTGDPMIKLDLQQGHVEENPQEKSKKKYKLNLGESKDNKPLHINMPLDSVREEPCNYGQKNTQYKDQQNQLQENNDYDDENSPIGNHFDENQDDVNEDYPRKNYIDSKLLFNSGQPLPSHRGSGPSQTASSIVAELNKKKQLLTFNQNGQSNKKMILPLKGECLHGYIQNEDEFEILQGEEQRGERYDPNRKIKYFSQICSMVIPNFLYVSGEDVANNLQKLKQNGITHIINCAGDVCRNRFPDEFTYKTYRLKDAKTENIECIFYDTIQFIENVAQQKGRVFIHCVQGISRSITLCIAYIIWKDKYDYNHALSLVKQTRDIASPNAGFLVQLINFYKRLYSPYESIIVRPRVWCVSSHQVEQPQLIVAKMLLEGLYTNNKLDPRGVFIIQSEVKLYIWIGSDIPSEISAKYQEYALQYIKNLRTYEHAPQELEIVKQYEESLEFWQMWFPSKPEDPYHYNELWNFWFIDITPKQEVDQGQTYFDEEEDESEDKPKLFVYPYYEPSNIFDFDDLSEENLCILCKQQEDQIKIHIWKGSQFAESDQAEKIFLDDIIQRHFPNHINNILLYHEVLHKESNEFIECFQSS